MKNFKPHEKWSISRRSFAKGSILALAGSWLGCRLRGEPLKRPDRAAHFINPIIGASTSELLGAGKIFPGSTTPFGMVQLSPDRLLEALRDLASSFEGDNGPGYSYEHTTIEGFSFLLTCHNGERRAPAWPASEAHRRIGTAPSNAKTVTPCPCVWA
jgi:putative alpha-1,2-mannosidase